MVPVEGSLVVLGSPVGVHLLPRDLGMLSPTVSTCTSAVDRVQEEKGPTPDPERVRPSVLVFSWRDTVGVGDAGPRSNGKTRCVVPVGVRQSLL